MIYAGIDVNIITHERAAAAGIEAFGLWCWGMCWAQIHESDGRLPRILVLSALRGRRNIMLAQRLVAAGLWIDREDGSWDIRNYAKKNQTALEIETKRSAMRAANAARQRNFKDRVRAGNASVTPGNGPTNTSTNTNTNTAPVLGPVTSEAEPVTAERPSMLRYREAYSAGIAKAKGSPYAWPCGPTAEWADRDLGHAIVTFAKSRSTGKALRGDDLLGWIQAAAEDMVAHVIATKDDPKFWSQYAPKALVRFLNQDTMATEARHVG